EVDGLTATKDEFLKIKKLLDIEVRVMLRNVYPGFEVTPPQLQLLKQEAKWFKENKADGFVFGFTRGKEIDVKASRQLLEHCAPLPCTFHKAFDTVDDFETSIDAIIKIGFDTLLTSAGAASAADGVQSLNRLIAMTNGQIKILVGGKVRKHNLNELHRQINTEYFHFRV
ncbi:MAG: copper homeostasis protein CutC, partial [Planctomycetota bacterium]|nr:copper homeostasis protein CutC [Planctomycetota bacterium]